MIPSFLGSNAPWNLENIHERPCYRNFSERATQVQTSLGLTCFKKIYILLCFTDTQSLSKEVARILFSKPDFKSLPPDSGDMATEFEKMKILMGKTKKTGQSSMDFMDSLQTVCIYT